MVWVLSVEPAPKPSTSIGLTKTFKDIILSDERLSEKAKASLVCDITISTQESD